MIYKVKTCNVDEKRGEKNMMIFPAVKKMTTHDGQIDLSHGLYYQHNKVTKRAKATFSNPFYEMTDLDQVQNLFFVEDQTLGKEAYKLAVNEQGVTITYKTEKGVFYAMKTLIQMYLQNEGVFTFVEIFDEPDLEIRGYMLDISRNKVPKLSTLKAYVDLLADLKYNHFELYVEGLSYQYASFKHLYQEGMTPITPVEYKKLERYAKNRMIDLVPCHNGLGHMTEWLKHYPELAIMPDGMYFWGAHRPSSTINPLDERSIELVKSFYRDAMKTSSSNFFNMNLDEPYELGHGRTEAAGKDIGVGQMYLDYVLKLYDFMKKENKTPMVWGDVLNHYPETLSKLPKDLIFVDWGYDYNYPFHQTLKRLGEHGVQFMAAPGTSSWNSMTGRTTTMFENIRQACLHTKMNGGRGMLLTDWGDNGHLQMLPASVPAICYAAMESWHARVHNMNEVRDCINFIAVEDVSGKTGQILLDMGRYVDYETPYKSNATELVSLMWAAKHLNPHDLQGSFYEMFKEHPYATMKTFNMMLDQMNLLEVYASKLRYRFKLDRIFKEELECSIKLTKAMMLLIRLQSSMIKHGEFETYKKWLVLQYPEILKSFKRLWLKRNKSGGLENSMTSLVLLGEVIKQIQPLSYLTIKTASKSVMARMSNQSSMIN